MRLNKLTLKNFRQFSEISVLEFSAASESSNNVDIIIGVNGAGKTTLLSALNFVFHGQVLDSLENPERLCNDEIFKNLLEGDEVLVEVELEFELRSVVYAVQRHLKVRKQGNKQVRMGSEFNLLNTLDGSLITPPGKWINSWFPPNLAKFFFFPGENLHTFFDERNFSSFAEDIKSVSGLDKTEMIMEAGNSALLLMQKRIAGIPGEDAATQIIESIKDNAEKVLDAEQLVSKLEEESKQALRELTSITNYLEERKSDVGALVTLAEARLKRDKLKNQRLELDERMDSFIKDKAWIPFVSVATSRALESLGTLRNQGKLENSFSLDSIRRLLDSKECICGRHLDEGDSARDHLLAMLEPRNLMEFPARYDFLESSIKSGVLNPEMAFAEWQHTTSSASLNSNELEEIDSEIQTLVKKAVDDSQDSYLESQILRQTELQNLIPDVEMRLGDAREAHRNLQQILRDKNAELAEAKVARGSHGILVRQHQSLTKVLNAISEDATRMKARLREDIEKEMQDLVAPIYNYKPATVSLDENFRVRVLRDGVSSLGADGQKTLLAFSLVLSLNRVAARISAEMQDEDFVEQVGEYPLVIDAGFGTLARPFYKTVIDWLREAAGQTIILSIDTHAIFILEELGQVNGPHVLRMHESAEYEDYCPEVLGIRAPLITYREKSSYTSIERLTN
jgi:DNA sulfur modification protein DndD